MIVHVACMGEVIDAYDICFEKNTKKGRTCQDLEDDGEQQWNLYQLRTVMR